MVTRPAQSGFTLIELLVVIAIIGILSAITLASLNMTRLKGNDGAVKSNLNNARAQAELFYDSNNNRYVGTVAGSDDVCAANASVGGVKGIYGFANAAANLTGTTLNTAINTVGTTNTVTCHSTPTSGPYNPLNGWAMEAPLRGNYPGITNPMYCVDSAGRATTTSGSYLSSGGKAECR